METYCHNSVSVVESFFNTISMMNIDIKIEYSGIDFEKFEYTDDNIIDIAEATCLGFSGMVVTSTPVDSNIRNTCDDNICCIETASCCKLCKVVQTFETWAIERLIDFIFGFEFGIISSLFPLLISIDIDNVILFGSDPFLQISHIARVMERCQFIICCLFTLEHV